MKSLWSKNSTEKVVPEILVEIKGVQQQTNSVDCGLFAIATSLAFGTSNAPCKMPLQKQMTCFPKSTGTCVSKCQSRLASILQL